MAVLYRMITIKYSARSACALAMYLMHSARPKIYGLLSRESIVDRQFISVSVRVTNNIGLCAVRCPQSLSDVVINFTVGFLYKVRVTRMWANAQPA